MCVRRARIAVGIGILLPLLAVLVEIWSTDGPLSLLERSKLTAADIASFDRDGFVVLHQVVPQSMIASLLTELHEIQAKAEQADVEHSAFSWDEKTSGADESNCTFAFARDENGALHRPVRLHKAQGIALRSPKVEQVLRFPPIAKNAATLVHRGLPGAPPAGGSATSFEMRLEVDAFGTKYFPVAAGSPGSVSWHDDNYYFGTTRSHTISCTVYLRDTNAHSGALRVLPGSHRDSAVGSERAHLYRPLASQHGEYIPESSILDELAAGSSGQLRKPVDVSVAAGSVVLFDANLLHSGHPNLLPSDGGVSAASERLAFHFIPGDLDSGFRGTSFARGRFADRHRVTLADGRIVNVNGQTRET